MSGVSFLVFYLGPGVGFLGFLGGSLKDLVVVQFLLYNFRISLSNWSMVLDYTHFLTRVILLVMSIMTGS